MVNKNEALIVEEDFFDVLLTKKNCIEIELAMLKFINNRKPNQFLAIDISKDGREEKTIFAYFEILKDGTKKIYDQDEFN